MKRRDALGKGIVAGMGTLAGARALANQTCGAVTPPQTEGPFYPEDLSRESDRDLTVLEGRQTEALGRRVFLTGEVLDRDCNPVSGALVEIWQACESGKYDHPADTFDAPLDPNFQYWGRTTTREGHFSFKTIKPGSYPATSTWLRPPHIHFKISAPGVRTLTTQMYFEGDELIESDRILANLTEEERRAVIVPVVENGDGISMHFVIRLGDIPELT